MKILTKKYIEENLIRIDGRLNNRKITADMDIESIYLMYKEMQKPKCRNAHPLKFLSFNKGYHKTSCEDTECTKERAYKNRVQDYNLIIGKMKKTKNERYGSESYVNLEKRKKTIKKQKEENKSRSKLHPKNNLINLNREFIEKRFIKDGVLLREEFMKYFSCKEDWMNRKLRELSITKTKIKFPEIITKEFIDIFMDSKGRISSPKLKNTIYLQKNYF